MYHTAANIAIVITKTTENDALANNIHTRKKQPPQSRGSDHSNSLIYVFASFY